MAAVQQQFALCYFSVPLSRTGHITWQGIPIELRTVPPARHLPAVQRDRLPFPVSTDRPYRNSRNKILEGYPIAIGTPLVATDAPGAYIQSAVGYL